MAEKKMNRALNKKMLSRLVVITNAIRAGNYPTNKDLRRIYEEETGESVSEATIARDIDTLRTYFAAPLEFDRAKHGYYFTESRWQFAYGSPSPDEIFYLSAAKSLLSNLEGSPIFSAIADAINLVTDAQSESKDAIFRRIALPPKPRFCIDEAIWQHILIALRENRVIEFDYKHRSFPKPTRRRVRPYQILFDGGQCFLFGYAKEKCATRLFSLSRISNVTETGEKFTLPDDFDFGSRCGGGKFGAYASGEVEEYVIDFYADSRDTVKDCIWADDQKIVDDEDEERTRIIFTSRQSEKVLEWVLSHGANAVPASPPELEEYWREQIAMMSENALIKSKEA